MKKVFIVPLIVFSLLVAGCSTQEQGEYYTDQEIENMLEEEFHSGYDEGYNDAVLDVNDKVEDLEFFLDYNVGVVVNDSELYHKYGCDVEGGTDNFSVYDVHQATYLGYQACTSCYEQDEIVVCCVRGGDNYHMYSCKYIQNNLDDFYCEKVNLAAEYRGRCKECKPPKI